MSSTLRPSRRSGRPMRFSSEAGLYIPGVTMPCPRSIEWYQAMESTSRRSAARSRSDMLTTGSALAGLLVEGVLAVPAAVLLHLDAVAVVRLVLERDVVAPLALFTGESHLHPLVARHLAVAPPPV